jgi:hypothetical protein
MSGSRTPRARKTLTGNLFLAESRLDTVQFFVGEAAEWQRCGIVAIITTAGSGE